MNSKSRKKRPFEEAIEMELKAPPEEVLRIGLTVVRQTQFVGVNYVFDLPTSEVDLRSNLTRILIWARGIPLPDDELSQMIEMQRVLARSEPIGVITLQPLPSNHTLFRIPPRGQWGTYGGYDLNGKDRLDTNGKYFTHLLTHVFNEFQRLGFIDSTEEPPLGFKPSHKEKGG